MAHSRKAQSTGSRVGNRDRHQVKKPKGTGTKPGPTKPSYVPPKYKR